MRDLQRDARSNTRQLFTYVRFVASDVAEVIARSAKLLILLEGISERYFRGTFRSKKTANYQIRVYQENSRLDIFKLRLFGNDALNGKSYSEVFACFRSAADRPRILNKCYLSVYLYSGMGRLKKYTRYATTGSYSIRIFREKNFSEIYAKKHSYSKFGIKITPRRSLARITRHWRRSMRSEKLLARENNIRFRVSR